MGFRKLDAKEACQFNSTLTSNLVFQYESFLNKKIENEIIRTRSQTFAPSGFRCARQQWFRLRGVDPDKPKKVDRSLDFTAFLGTCCHERLQSHIKEMLPTAWVELADYLETKPEIKEKVVLEKDGYETKVSMNSPPVRFACDGILKIEDKYYLLEIKTSEGSSFSHLTGPKPNHVDQVNCYCALLDIEDVIMIYQERNYGTVKSYQFSVPKYQRTEILHKMKYIMECVDNNIAPEKLPYGDLSCSGCSYQSKCKLW